MNEANYASLEASKRLVDAGIVLETEKSWIMSSTGWELADNIKYYGFWKDAKKYPAPSMAEVWRELPDATQIILIKRGVFHVVHYASNTIYTRKNPTDALIDLLIWVRKEKS